MDIKDLRYIVFMLDPNVPQFLSGVRVDTHAGTIFCSLKDAKEYAVDAIKENLCTRFVIGLFVWEKEAQSIHIDMVETFGFRHDRKNINQLELFEKTI